MAHRRTAYNDWPRRAIRTKSRQQCASESGEVLEIRNRLSFKDHATVNHEHSVSLDRLHRVRKLDSKPLRNVNIAHRGRLRRLEKLDLFITNRVGSMGFFFSVFAWTALWLSWNTLAPKPLRFDPSSPLFYGFYLQCDSANADALIMVGQNL